MFDKRFVLTGVAIAAVTALSFFIADSHRDEQVQPITESVSGVERKAGTPEPPEPDYEYMIKEHEGRIAVYRAGAEKPELVLDVLMKYLPDYDRSQIAQGIPVKDYDELVALIEDFTS